MADHVRIGVESSSGSALSRLALTVRSAASTVSWPMWIFVVLLWSLALLGFGWLNKLDATAGYDLHVPWWALAIGFYFAEVFVVHLQFRKDAHTLSMSEVPMVFGLLFATPIALLVGQLLGSAVALVIHRKQRPIKLAVNLGQLALQAVLAVAVFRSLDGGEGTLDVTAMVAVVAASLAALFVGHIAVLIAIRLSGGRESVAETGRVFAVSSLGTVGAAILAFGAAIVAISSPYLWWIGFVPVTFVFISYRAYIEQSQDKARVAALFEAATALHRHPQIDRAVLSVAEWVLDLVKCETAVVVVYPEENDPGPPYVSVVDNRGTRRVMARHSRPDIKLSLLSRHTVASVLNDEDLADLEVFLLPQHRVRDAVAEILTVGGRPVGLLAGINRVGDVSAFDSTDAQVLATLGSQLSTSLENGRLSDSLSEIRLLKDQLESLLVSKDRLIASVSHELRTPLTGVIGLTSLIRDTSVGQLDEETLALLDMVVEQGTELSNIIEDLLTYARAEAGTLHIDPVPFSLTQETAMVAASQGVDPPIAADDVWAMGDPLRTRQILRNLVTNARRYGGPNIQLLVDSKAHTAEVTVADDGPGVPDESAEAIFEPYRSAHNRIAEPGSVGLGLSVSRSMARMMGGDLTYERQNGQTRFTLSLSTITDLTSLQVAAEVV